MLRICKGQYTGDSYHLSPEEFLEKAQRKFPEAGRLAALREYAKLCGLIIPGTDLYALESGIYSMSMLSYRGELGVKVGQYGDIIFTYTDRWDASEGEDDDIGTRETFTCAEDICTLFQKLGWHDVVSLNRKKEE